MTTFYNIRIDGTLKWIYGEDEERKALKTYYRLQKEKPDEQVTIDRKDTDEMGIIKRTYSYIEEYDVWAEDRKGRKRNGSILHNKKKRTTRGNVRRKG
ncbi:MAG: hypothetical protein E6271_01375 [Negativicoccus succinicivorans]|nr:hypothetical protein [Negativicoccus succinicivorans]